MRKVTLSIPVALLALCLGAAQLTAQQPGSGNFRWYVGGQGGITSFRSPLTGREYLPTAGGHILITARRTGLLLSVDEGFGSNQVTSTGWEVRDSVDNVIASGAENWTFKGTRRFSAMVMAYPVRMPNIQPYVGVGLGFAHTTSNSEGPFAGGRVEGGLSSAGFLAAMAGLEFRLGPFSAFGQWQVASKHGFHQVTTVLRRDQSGKILERRIDYGEWTLGANHTLTGGLRFSLGNARERATGGGY
jgi:Outer membrane protein beta-barrel domain